MRHPAPSDPKSKQTTASSASESPNTREEARSLVRDQRASGVRTIRRVAPYLWPEDKPWVKRRVVIALLMLLAAKVVAVGTPLIYKRAVDALSEQGAPDLVLGAVGLTVAYGVARPLGPSGCIYGSPLPSPNGA